jgi:hypothetical protein
MIHLFLVFGASHLSGAVFDVGENGGAALNPF